MLNSVLEENPQFKKCLTRCVDCQIEFLTDPRNGGREDLRCPFGCRVEHHRRESNRRVKEYYNSEEGKKKKIWLNQRRKEKIPKKKPQEPKAVSARSLIIANSAKYPSEDMIEYLRMLAGLLERRKVSADEIYMLLRKKMRQHRMYKQRKLWYNVEYLIKNPP